MKIIIPFTICILTGVLLSFFTYLIWYEGYNPVILLLLFVLPTLTSIEMPWMKRLYEEKENKPSTTNYR